MKKWHYWMAGLITTGIALECIWDEFGTFIGGPFR